MDIFLQLLIRGFIEGSMYALLGVSWGIIYNTTRTFHFAHSIVYTASAYVIVLLKMNAGFPLILSLLAGLVSAVFLGCSCEFFAYRPLRKRGGSQLVIFLTAMGIMILGENLIHIILGPNSRPLSGFPDVTIFIGPVTFTTLDIIAVVVVWASIGLLVFCLNHTKAGKIVRAVSSNSEKAITIGIDVDKAFLLVFAIGSIYMALAAFLYALDRGISPGIGLPALLNAFIAVFLGGLRGNFGAVFGGLVMGFAESLSLFVMPAQYKVIVMFIILFVVIAFKPEGLIGGTGENDK